ncbi:MAG: glycoside hydrolase family 25 protein [Clostridia bacterium]|jgi:GH25 family lysozyme M1 (1,4-beta-N-acetylmuramidase)|nr:glycoside hydrolase family 25 protein [Clostridia bacterium]MCI2014081.1 glycoside hydrolase family 25 protein [Clostridia bacterium]
MLKGFDISKHNGTVDFAAAKAAGLSFVIIRSSYGTDTTDIKFEENYKRAKAAGLKVGVYHYSYALCANDALKEAKYVYGLIKDKQLDMPILFDMEDADGYKNKHGINLYNDKALINSICSTFINYIQSQGLKCGIYASKSVLTKVIDKSIALYFWNAQWGNNDEIKHTMWQYTDSGSISGCSGNFDLDVCYKDFEEKEDDDDMMTQAQFNEMMNTYLSSLKTEEPADWSKEARTWAESNNIIAGDENGNKQYKNFVTREQLMLFLMRLFNKIETS